MHTRRASYPMLIAWLHAPLAVAEYFHHAHEIVTIEISEQRTGDAVRSVSCDQRSHPAADLSRWWQREANRSSRSCDGKSITLYDVTRE